MIFRILGLIIGGSLGGFWGAIGGYLIGALISSLTGKSHVSYSFQRHNFSQEDFIDVLMRLTAAVMKADNKMLKSELDYVKSYLIKNIGATKAQEAILKLRDYLNQDIDIQYICNNIKSNSNIQERILILQFLFGLAQADGHIDDTEINVIRNIAIGIGIPSSTFEALKSMFVGYGYQGSYSSGYSSGYGYGSGYGYSSGSSNYGSSSYHNLNDDYKILEVSPDATDEEVKKAYRKAAIKHHPDKVNHLGEEVRKAAEEKFAKVNEAYERIKKSRGMN
jgi:DnaJ like chaperone protein